MKTTTQMQKQVEKVKISEWLIHVCSMCDYSCGFLFNNKNVMYDNGCYCVSSIIIRDATWEEVANAYNRNQPEQNPQISEDYLNKTEKIWQFNK